MHFKTPFSMLVCGPSNAGKTSFIVNLVENLEKVVCGSPISQVLWCFKSENSKPKALENNTIVKFIEGIPSDISEISPNTLIIFDDLMMDAFSKEVVEIFTVHSHHGNLSTILVLHNLFHQNKYTRNISLNTKYIVYFKNPRDLSSLGVLSRQLCPSNWRNLQKLFIEALCEAYSYLIIDLAQDTLDIFKFRNNIFNKHGTFNCYTTKNLSNNIK